MTWPEAVKLSVATDEGCIRLRVGNRELVVGSEAVMVREHVQAIRAHCSTVLCGENDYGDVLDDIVRHALELEADLAALKAYALMLETILIDEGRTAHEVWSWRPHGVGLGEDG